MLLLKMRSGIFSYLFLAALVMGTVGLVLMDWTGTYRNIHGSTDVAVVNGKPISSSEFDRMAKRILRSQNMTAETAYKTGMIDQILEVTIMDQLLKQAAYDYGLIVDDAHVAKQINDLITPMVTKGSDKKQTLARILQSQNMSEGELVDNLRASISTQLLRDAITKNYYIPAAVATDLHKYASEQRSVEAITLPQASAATVKPPTDAELATYFETIKERYTAPENRSFTVGIIDPTALATDVKISDDDVKKYYDDNKDDFAVKERRLIEQAVLDTKEKADAVLKAAQSSKKPLQDALKSVTKDTKGYLAETGFEKASLPEELGTAIFAAPVNTYVGPLKSPLGWHVVFVKTIQAPQIQPFDKVSAGIRKDLEQNAEGDKLYAAVNAIDDRISGGATLEEVAKDTKMTLVKLTDVRMSQPDFPELKPYEADEGKILQTAFGLQEGETSALSDMSTGKMYTVHLDGTKPKRQKDLKEVKDDVQKLWIEDKQAKANVLYVKEALEKLNAGKTTLDAIAKEKNVKVQTFTGITREAKAPAGLSEGNIQMLMSGDKGKFMAMPGKDGITIARVTGIKITDQAASAKDITTMQEKTGSDVSQENLLMFVDDLEAQYKTTKNQPLLQQMYGGTQESQ